MKRYVYSICTVLLLTFFCNTSFAQCFANAGNDATVCEGNNTDTIHLGGNPLVVGGIPPYTYQWFDESGSADYYLDDATKANPAIVRRMSQPQMYFYLTVTDSMGVECKDTVLIRNCGFMCNLSDPRSYIDPGDTVHLYPTCSSTCGEYRIRWQPAYNISDTISLYPSVWPEITTNYFVTITDSGGCERWAGDYLVIVSALGIRSFDVSNVQVDISPNPMREQSTIRITSGELRNGQLLVFDALGRRLQQTPIRSSVILKREDFNTGIYFYQVFEGNQLAAQGKLVVQ